MDSGLYNLQNEVKNPNKEFFEDEVREGFYVWTMMKRFWAAQLKILSEIDIICKRHGLRWYADNGTLLGAVRHRGYIPWDDDLDICMFRDDYITFVKYAQKELPEGYVIKDVQLLDGFDNMIGRVNGSAMIHYEDEYLKRNFGCPYIVGVDIFPLDGIYKDEKKEEERLKRATNIFGALVLVSSGETNTELFKGLLADIEQKNNIAINRDGDVKRQLILLADKVISECPVSEAENVAQMAFYVEFHDHIYSKEWFKSTVYLPFEYIHISAPAQYDKVLHTEYRNYMKVVKSGGIHDYPLYQKQEEAQKKGIGENVLRYTMPAEYKKREVATAICDRYSDIENMLKQVHLQIAKYSSQRNHIAVSQLIDGCLKLIQSVYGLIYERGDEIAVHEAIDGYRVTLVGCKEASVEDDQPSSGEEIYNPQTLDERLEKVTEEINRLIKGRKKEILFLPVRSDWWNTMEPEWRMAIENDANDVYVMPLLYLEKDYIKDEGEEKNDAAFLPEYVKCISIEDYDIAKRHPERVYIQDPYDGFSTMIAIPDYFYSDNLLKYTDELVYVPCFDVDPPEAKGDKTSASLKMLVEQPAVYHSDRIIVKDEKLRTAYIDILASISGEETRDYWESKVCVTESQISADKETILREQIEELIPEKWKGRLDGKKKLLYQVSSSFILEYGQAAINKIKESIRTIKANKDSIVCIFSPHETLEQLDDEVLSSNVYTQLSELLSEIRSDADIVYDDEHYANELWDISDAYYGTEGYLAHMCSENKIPTMIMAIV